MKAKRLIRKGRPFYFASLVQMPLNNTQSILLISTAIVIAYIFSLIPTVNALSLIALSLVAFSYQQKAATNGLKILCWSLMVPLAFVSATYRPEGFSYPLLLEVYAGDASKNFSLYANFSKGLVGLFLLVLLWPKTTTGLFKAPLRWSVMTLLLSPVCVIICAILLLDLEWDVKPFKQVLVFALANLLLTCVAEEAFMRFLLQHPFILVMKRFSSSSWLQELIPLIAVVIIFVVIHSGISGIAQWVFALAGLLYGLVYSLSKNIFYPIAVHAAVNILHFSLLTYPV